MVLISELVKALNLYSNPRVTQNSNVNKNSNARGASKRFWMQKAQFNWILSGMVLVLHYSTLCDHFFWVGFLFSLFLGFALHNIHVFHSRLVLLFRKKKKKEKGSKMCYALFSWIWNQGWPIYFYITCLCILFSLDELIYYTWLVEAL